MRKIIAILVLALVVSCGAPPSMDGGMVVPVDSGMSVDNGMSDTVTPPADTAMPGDVPVMPDVPVPPPDTTGPTSMDLPVGRAYNAPGGNGAIPCADRLSGYWGFPSGERPIYEGLRNEMRMLNISVGTEPMVSVNWTWSVIADMAFYWNNFGQMSREVHCRLRVMDATACNRIEIQCFAAGIDPARGGMPMPGGTIVAGKNRDL